MKNSEQRCWFESVRRGGNTEEEAGLMEGHLVARPLLSPETLPRRNQNVGLHPVNYF